VKEAIKKQYGYEPAVKGFGQRLTIACEVGDVDRLVTRNSAESDRLITKPGTPYSK
jgi:hypothetical protein